MIFKDPHRRDHPSDKQETTQRENGGQNTVRDQ